MRGFTRHMGVLLAAGAAAAALVAGGAPAMADRHPVNAAGNTVIQIAAPFVKALSADPNCGAVTASGTGQGEAVVVGKGKLKVTLPVTGIVLTDAGAIRVVHSGGVELQNDCYDIRLTNFYVQNFGDAGQYETFDVLAKTKDSPDEQTDPRTEVFTLDLSEAQYTETTKGATKIRSMNLLMGDDGAEEFNTLQTGDPATGSFTEGLQVGKARSTIKLLYSDIDAS